MHLSFPLARRKKEFLFKVPELTVAMVTRLTLKGREDHVHRFFQLPDCNSRENPTNFGIANPLCVMEVL